MPQELNQQPAGIAARTLTLGERFFRRLYAGFEPDPTLPTRLAASSVPTLLIVGEYDIWPTAAALRQLASLFSEAELLVFSSAGHFPWVDDPTTFTASVERFLATTG